MNEFDAELMKIALQKSEFICVLALLSYRIPLDADFRLLAPEIYGPCKSFLSLNNVALAAKATHYTMPTGKTAACNA